MEDELASDGEVAGNDDGQRDEESGQQGAVRVGKPRRTRVREVQSTGQFEWLQHVTVDKTMMSKCLT